MSLFRSKMAEVARSLMPVMALVVLLSVTIVKPDGATMARFLIGGGLLLVGLAIFLLGVDLAMNPIGDYMAVETATSKTALKASFLSFMLGFLVTVAEPDLLILGNQVQAASGGAIKAQVMVYLVSAGVGLLIMLGTFRLLKNRSFPLFMGLAYLGIFVLSLFVSEEFLAISFDSSGATTGALTTPFILALSAGLSRIKGGKKAEEDSFGLVGVMSAGPMYALMLMSIITGQKHIMGEATPFVPAAGILRPILGRVPPVMLESLLALAPLCLLFFAFNFLRFKAPQREIARIVKGLVYTLIGLTIFLTGVYAGFMDMGQLIGRSIASKHAWLLPVTGFLIGMIVVLVEPAVLVLGQQVEEVTGGRIPNRLLKATLSIGVALAILCSMLRIMIPWVKLWYFLLPGFGAAVILSFISDPVFVGIAYDAGGVASGPMTATFVLAFAQGAAAMTPTANVLVDGFGVIAMVAMAPVLSLMILGAVFKKRMDLDATKPLPTQAQPVPRLEGVSFYDCVIAVINRGGADEAIALARRAGATGATVIHGRGSGGHDVRLFSVSLQKEKEAVLWLVDERLSDSIAKALYEGLDLGGAGGGKVFIVPCAGMGLDDWSGMVTTDEQILPTASDADAAPAEALVPTNKPLEDAADTVPALPDPDKTLTPASAPAPHDETDGPDESNSEENTDTAPTP